MNKIELQKLLIEENITPLAYCLEGGLPNECYTLNNTGAGWEVYYSERGRKVGLAKFDIEHEACDFIYQWLIKGLK